MASSVLKSLLLRFSSSRNTTTTRSFSLVTPQISNHTAKWMQDTSKKSPMELINEVPPIKVESRIVACEGGTAFRNSVLFEHEQDLGEIQTLYSFQSYIL
ncbi:NADH dehydrogenase [ubiquinone] iron-sulfur protein 6, mitochondrial isoform E [Glycine soja]|uniref:NADH dehydrogenase [ubiquinone] iron-sulfur protein 6, mitochondrial isoform D n=1 Tax=Glycine soja TaxID=3848 RepID=A0A445HYZ8_GLYSO|nr:NADH dehydrogenase [ubiquinone] iron-sulfur protein 6, mitochondrial isoform D [Glycine soja]RZB79050.1 NADH dehydrogenase [ubiquinone] iron-sulfur protein 6, mitochondrial isoform E [Glycine soja]